MTTMALTQTCNVQTMLWAVGRTVVKLVVLVALLLAALWVARSMIGASALAVGAGAWLLANPLVVICLVGIALYAYITYPKGPVRR
jgi:hypothetical protein